MLRVNRIAKAIARTRTTNIGDTVKIRTYTGTVLSFTLRNTRLKTNNGAVIYIPNRNITIVENLTHGSHSGWSMNINLNLSVDNDLTTVNHAINTVNAALKDKFKNQIKKDTRLGGGGVDLEALGE